MTDASTSGLDPIVTFLPGRTEVEYALRRRIHRAQGASTSRATRSCHWRARSILWIAAQLAADWQFKGASEQHLREIITALTQLTLAANIIERLETPDGD